MVLRSTMTPLITHLRGQGEAATTDQFNGVTYWTDEQLQDILDTNSLGLQEIQLAKLGLYDNVTYALNVPSTYWVEGGFSIYVAGSTTEETTTYTYNSFTHQLVFDSDVADRSLIAFAKVYLMTDAIADLWNQKAQHRKDYITFKAGAHRMEAEQIYNHCVRQADFWRNLRVRSFKRRQTGRFVRYD